MEWPFANVLTVKNLRMRVMSNKFFNMDNEDLTQIANQVKDQLCERLDIPKLDDYVVIVTEPNIFGRAFNKVTNKESNAVIRVMKVIPE
jgi:hypothetical protein